jgi:hypothetical protein
MINAGAVPALVKVNEVGVPNPLAKVKAMLDPLVVVMVLPPLYADWRLKVAPEHSTTSFDPFKQSAAPEDVPKPVMSKNEVPVVAIVTFSPAPCGLRVVESYAVRLP